MCGLNRIVTKFRGAAFRIERFDHPEHRAHPVRVSEQTEFFAVTFIERGGFEIRQGREGWLLSQGDVVVSVPGLKRCYRHFRECPDDVCLVICFAPDAVEDALGRLPGHPLPPRIPFGPASDFAFRWIVNALNSRDPMAIETAGFHCAGALGPHSWTRGPRLSGAASHARAMQSVCLYMVDRLAEPHSLSSVAREARMSTFHFARVFSELVGESPHQYLLKARLRYAASMLRQGASVEKAALESGFLNVSYFSRIFHRRYGIPPSRYSS